MLGHGALDEHVAARRRRGAEEGAGLDAVGDDRVIDRVQRVDAFDVDDVGARAVDARAHLVEHPRELLDFGLPRGAYELRAAAREGRGHHEVFGARHRGHVEVDGGPAEARALGVDVPVLQGDGRAHGLEALEVLVDGPRADGAAAGERHPRRAEAREERAQHEHRGPHLLHQLVGRLGAAHRRAANLHHRGLDGGLGAHEAQEGPHRLDIAQPRNIPKRTRPLREQGGREDGQGRVFRARNPDRSVQGQGPLDDQVVHRAHAV